MSENKNMCSVQGEVTIEALPEPSFPNLRHLFAFSEVAKNKSVSLAAIAVHLSQPAITQAIANLEKQVAVKLFERGNSGMFLTEAGEVFFARVIRALEQIKEGTADVSQLLNRKGAGLERLITTAQLRALVAVVDNGNFAMAARASGVSQPTIHRAARDLERVMKVPLFEKTSFGVQPTKEARKMAICTKLAFGELRQAWSEINALKGMNTGTIVIGTMPLSRTYLVPKAIVKFAAEYPDQNIEILEGAYEHLLEGLRSGTVDVLVGALRSSLPVDDVVEHHLFHDPLSIVVGRQHPLAQKTSVTSDMLARYPWIAPRRGTPLRHHFDQFFALMKIRRPKRLIECNSLVAARALLLESDLLMLLSSNQIRYERESGLLVELPFFGLTVTRDIGYTVRRNWQPTSAQTRLIELLSCQSPM